MPNPLPTHAKGYAVGYGKPPQSSRFKPGQSGNPKGRPRQKQRISDFEEGLGPVLAAAARVMEKKVQFKKRGKVQQTTGLDALMQTLLAHAIDGDVRASRMLLALMERAEEKVRKRQDSNQSTHQLVVQFSQTMRRLKALGLWDVETLGEPLEPTETEVGVSEAIASEPPRCAMPCDEDDFDLVGVLGRKDQTGKCKGLGGDLDNSEKGAGSTTAPQLRRYGTEANTTPRGQGKDTPAQPTAAPITFVAAAPRRPDEPLIRDERPLVSGHRYGTYGKA